MKKSPLESHQEAQAALTLWRVSGHTIEELGALGITFLHLFAFVRGCLHVAVRGREDCRPRLH